MVVISKPDSSSIFSLPVRRTYQPSADDLGWDCSCLIGEDKGEITMIDTENLPVRIIK